MSAPVATQPLPENDSRPARPVYYQTPSGAEGYAKRLAAAASTDGLARPVEFVQGVYQGGSRFFAAESAAPSDDYVVRELPAAEVTRRQQAGIRAAIERCGHEVKAHQLGAGIAKPGSCFERIHLERVAQVKDRIRELELRLTVAAAPAVTVAAVLSDGGLALANRNSALCKCGSGKRIYRDNMCVVCAEDAFEARNRAQSPEMQRD